MSKAYILINIESGSEKFVSSSIKSIDNVLTCNVVYGAYDIIVEVVYDTMSQLQDTIQEKIRRVNKIRSTITLIPFDF